MTALATISARPAIRSRRSSWGRSRIPTQTIPVYPTFNEAYTAAWVNDEFKVNDNLTLTLGLRFDYQFARTESDDQYSTFDPNTPNPGAGNLPGALIFAGDCAGCSGRRKFEDPKKDAWGPRVGFAYRLGETKRDSWRLRDLLRRRRVLAIHRAADAWLRGEPAGAEPHQRRAPRILSGRWVPCSERRAAAVHQSDIRQRHVAAGRGARWVDTAALPELVA